MNTAYHAAEPCNRFIAAESSPGCASCGWTRAMHVKLGDLLVFDDGTSVPYRSDAALARLASFAMEVNHPLQSIVHALERGETVKAEGQTCHLEGRK